MSIDTMNETLTSKQKKYVEGKLGDDICISCLKIFSHFHQDSMSIDECDKLNSELGESEYLVNFFICGDCKSNKFRDNMLFILKLFKEREKHEIKDGKNTV